MVPTFLEPDGPVEVSVRCVNKVSTLYRGNKVDSFRVAMFLGGDSADNVDEWIHFAITRGQNRKHTVI